MKGEDKKTLKTLNIVLMVLESFFLAFTVLVSVLLFTITDQVKSRVDQLNPTAVVLEDSESLKLSEFKEGDILLNSKVTNSNFVVNLGVVASYAKYQNGSVYLETSRIVGYRFYDYGNEMYQNVYYKKGEMEKYTDLSLKLQKANWQFYGYVTRDDNVSLDNGASLQDLTIYKDGDVVTAKDKDLVFVDDILSVNEGKVVKGLGMLHIVFRKSINFILLITVPLVIFISLNVFMFIVDMDKKEDKLANKESGRRENS